MEKMLAIQIEDLHPIAVIKLKGFLAHLEVYKFKNTIEQLFTDGKRFLVVDLNEVTFIDSAGVGSLVQMRNECIKVGGQLVLIEASTAQVKQVMEVASLPKVIEFFPDAPSAVKHLRVKHSLPGGQEQQEHVARLEEVLAQIGALDARLTRIEATLESIEALLKK